MTLVSRSADLSKLVEEGYDIEVRDGNLLVHYVPFVNAEGKVEHGILVAELSTNGERTIAPGRHEVWVVGGVPHDHEGKAILVADTNTHDYGNDLVASCRLSGKPHNRMPADYHEMISNYVDILGRFARVIDPSATHTDFPLRESADDESPFRYHDSATSRSRISAVTGKLKIGKIAIVGLGGTGSYILDQVAKTPVGEIHLFDDDTLFAHNAFRAPGAATFEELRAEPLKVDYHFGRYDPLRRGIVPHAVRIDEGNVGELQGMDFVFLAMDAGPSKRSIIEHLKASNTPFVDCGMGLQRQENSLRGTVRVTAGVEGRYDHLSVRLSYVDAGSNEYDDNIQTADLNMLNAALAVIKWKKLFGYYADTKHELHSTYSVARNRLLSSEVGED